MCVCVYIGIDIYIYIDSKNNKNWVNESENDSLKVWSAAESQCGDDWLFWILSF